MGGTKYDDDKLRMDLIPKEALDGMAKVLGFGAKKYDDHNWRKGIKHNRLYAACLRHLTVYWDGETFDPESGANHLEHAMTNLAFMLASPEYDDRYRGGENGDSIRHRDDGDPQDRDQGHKEDPLPCSFGYNYNDEVLCRRDDRLCFYPDNPKKCFGYRCP